MKGKGWLQLALWFWGMMRLEDPAHPIAAGKTIATRREKTKNQEMATAYAKLLPKVAGWL